MIRITNQTFYAAAFALDGELVGVGEWRLAALSPRWLDFSREVLQAGGSSFEGSLPSPFEHISLRFTSARGAALVTFSLRALPVASSAFLRGQDAAAERQVLRMFVDSARRVDAVRQSQRTSQPFEEVFSISERPLHVVIAWGASSEEDAGMVAELGTHLAGAFLHGDDAA